MSQRSQLRWLCGHDFIRGLPDGRGVREEEVHDLPSEEPVRETLMAKTSRLRSVANAAVIATFSAPQEVKFTSIVNSPVKLAASDESGEDSVSLKILGEHEYCHQDMDRSATQSQDSSEQILAACVVVNTDLRTCQR